MRYKNKEVEDGYASIHPIVKELCETANKWSLAYDKEPITLTDTLSNPARDKQLNRESPAHSQGRAVDIRVNDWSAQKITAFQKHFNTKFIYLGYIRRSNNQRILMYLHGEGANRHIHMAIGLDVIAKYKNSYPNWRAPVHTTKVKPASKEK
jgi:hypothetical protein